MAVVVAYGMLLPKAILEAPELGCLNLHASLLPRWRGAAPIQRAIMAGDRETGVAVMKMEEGLDTGPVAMVERVAITPDMNAGELHDRLMVLGADLMVRALAALSRGGLGFTPQPEEGVTYAHKLRNEEALIDWSKPAQAVHDHIRGLSPFPGAYFTADFGKGQERVKVLRATLADRLGRPRDTARQQWYNRLRRRGDPSGPGSASRQGARGLRRIPARREAWSGRPLRVMHDMTIRLEESTDWPAIHAIYDAAFGQIGGSRPRPATCESDGDLILSLLAYDEKPAGHIAYSRLALHEAPSVQGLRAGAAGGLARLPEAGRRDGPRPAEPAAPDG